MSRALSSELLAIKNLMQDDGAWVWAVKISYLVNEDQPQHFYLVKNTAAVTIASKVYQPYPFDISGFEESEEGKHNELRLSMNDFTGEIHDRCRTAPIEGSDATVMLVYLGNNLGPANPEVALTENYIIKSWDSSIETITFRLGHRNWLQHKYPGRRVFRETCGFRFKGSRCGYGTGVTGAGSGNYTTCDYSFDGPNGCVVKGNAERFGGFPSLPFGRGQR